MGTSRHRKNHKKKLQAYKNRMGQARNRMAKVYQEAMRQQLELMIAERKKQQESEEVTTENATTSFVEE
jgi:hypothetical protein